MGNFIKASYAAITATYGFLTPDLWTKIEVRTNIASKSRRQAPDSSSRLAALPVAVRGVLVAPPARCQEGLLSASRASGASRSVFYSRVEQFDVVFAVLG